MKVQQPMFGLETEYGLTGLAGNSGLDRARLAGSVLSVAREQCTHLPDVQGSGLFLANGSRLYIDCGHHPEMATPECMNPWDVVRYVKAGERILRGVARTLESRSPAGTEVLFFLCNVDYSGRVTWGCHESYLCRTDTHVIAPQLIPHLVTRVIFTGAGGFDPLSDGIEFSLFPRAAFFREVVSGNSTEGRGIIHTKDESLASGGYRRLHLICGESLCSELAILLKVGTTALVVAMAEQGVRPGEPVGLAEPVKALRTVASDPLCGKPLSLADGRSLTAIEIQRHYLALAESHLGKPWMPSWARDVCDKWRQTLDALEQGSDSVRTRLDWAIKLALYSDYARRAGLSWEALGGWSEVLATLRPALQRNGLWGTPMRTGLILDPNNPVIEEAARMTHFLRARGTSWEDAERYLSLKCDLQEADVRFGQLGENGIFHALDSAGLLEHRVTEPESLARAMTEPPAQGRALQRGETIRRLAGGARYRCDWQGIWDVVGDRILDLSNPFADQESWKDTSLRARMRAIGEHLPFARAASGASELL